MSERRACNALDKGRAIQWRTPRVRDEEERWKCRFIDLSAVFGRHGTLRINAILKDEGWHVHHNRIERISW